MKMYGDFQKGQYQEKNLRYGVREHGMGAIANGIALHNPGMIPYCATFFNFTDYMRGAIRMAALSRVILSIDYALHLQKQQHKVPCFKLRSVVCKAC